MEELANAWNNSRKTHDLDSTLELAVQSSTFSHAVAMSQHENRPDSTCWLFMLISEVDLMWFHKSHCAHAWDDFSCWKSLFAASQITQLSLAEFNLFKKWLFDSKSFSAVYAQLTRARVQFPCHNSDELACMRCWVQLNFYLDNSIVFQLLKIMRPRTQLSFLSQGQIALHFSLKWLSYFLV